jgi:hypothetical protein
MQGRGSIEMIPQVIRTQADVIDQQGMNDESEHADFIRFLVSVGYIVSSRVSFQRPVG